MRRLLPAFALGVAVLGAMAWWWFGASPRGRVTPTPPAVDTPPHGISMKKFSLRDSQRHQTRWEILADIAHVDPKADTTSIEGVHLTLFSEQHGPVQVTARRGVIDNQSKAMQVCGDVRLVVGEEFALSAECLQWDAIEQCLETTTSVVIHMGALHVQGLGFRGWLAEERFEIQAQVLARWSEL